MEGVTKRIDMEYMLCDDEHQHVKEDEKRAEYDAAWTGEKCFPQAQQAGSEAEKDGCEHERGTDESADIKSLFVQMQVLVFQKQCRFVFRVFFILAYEAGIDRHYGIEFSGPWWLCVWLAVVGQRFCRRLENG